MDCGNESGEHGPKHQLYILELWNNEARIWTLGSLATVADGRGLTAACWTDAAGMAQTNIFIQMIVQMIVSQNYENLGNRSWSASLYVHLIMYLYTKGWVGQPTSVSMSLWNMRSLQSSTACSESTLCRPQLGANFCFSLRGNSKNSLETFKTPSKSDWGRSCSRTCTTTLNVFTSQSFLSATEILWLGCQQLQDFNTLDSNTSAAQGSVHKNIVEFLC